MASTLEKVSCIRVLGSDDSTFDMIHEVFESINKSWPGSSFKNFAFRTYYDVEQEVTQVRLVMDRVVQD
jgi:hypothetical protein